MIVALRAQLNSQQLGVAQSKMTEAIVSGLSEEIAKFGAQAERTAIADKFGDVYAQGVRLRASLKGDTGDADIYWFQIGGRLIHVIFVGSDQERARASSAWKMIRATFRVETTPVSPPKQGAAPDLSALTYKQITGRSVDL